MKAWLREYIYQIMSGQRRIAAFFLAPILFLLSQMYRFVSFIRSALYSRNAIWTYRSSKKVISVGNISLGGSGKTPVVAYIAKHLRKRGHSHAVIMRGYMIEAGKESDEASMLKEILPDSYVYSGADRVASMKRADQEHDIDAFILDDGFQHRRVARDLDIVLVDACDPFGNGHLLPWGILREAPQAIGRAALVILTRCDIGRDHIAGIRQMCARVNPGVGVVEAVHQPVSVTHLFSGEKVADLSIIKDRICAACAIGSPEAFRATLRDLGADICSFFPFMDHHVYAERDVKAIVATCHENMIKKVVITHKDAVKLAGFREYFIGVDVLVLNIELRITHGEIELLSRLDSLFGS